MALYSRLERSAARTVFELLRLPHIPLTRIVIVHNEIKNVISELEGVFLYVKQTAM